PQNNLQRKVRKMTTKNANQPREIDQKTMQNRRSNIQTELKPTGTQEKTKNECRAGAGFQTNKQTAFEDTNHGTGLTSCGSPHSATTRTSFVELSANSCAFSLIATAPMLSPE